MIAILTEPNDAWRAAAHVQARQTLTQSVGSLILWRFPCLSRPSKSRTEMRTYSRSFATIFSAPYTLLDLVQLTRIWEAQYLRKLLASCSTLYPAIRNGLLYRGLCCCIDYSCCPRHGLVAKPSLRRRNRCCSELRSVSCDGWKNLH